MVRRYRDQFSPWQKGRQVVALRPKSGFPDVYDLHRAGTRHHGLYAYDYKKQVPLKPSLTKENIARKLYLSSIVVNHWIMLNIMEHKHD